MRPVGLITPPSPFLLDERVFVSLGILRVAAVLEAEGVSVEMLDLSGVENYEDAAAAWAANTQASHVGITATTPQLPNVMRIVARIRQANSNIRIILGGPHVTLVQAAYKREKKDGRAGRATDALNQLRFAFDTLVCGDGEDAIFHALMPDAPKVIDADDPASRMFQTNERLDAAPLPARHLVDMDSYHYSIDGFKATSLIGQLGCLAAGALIEMADGSQRPIENVRKGDNVVCLDEDTGQFRIAPVAAHWHRHAKDLWRIELYNNRRLLVTSEHPVWTKAGWRKVEDLTVGDEIGCVPEMRSGYHKDCKSLRPMPESADSRAHMPALQKDILSEAGVCPATELVQLQVPGRVAKIQRQPELAKGGAGGNVCKVEGNDGGGAVSILQYRKSEIGSGNPKVSEADFREQGGRTQPNEAARSGTKGLGNNQAGAFRFPVSETEEAMAGWQDAEDASGGQPIAEWGGDNSFGHTEGCCAAVSLRRQQSVLDRSMRVGATAKSRLHRQSEQEGNTASRGILALSRKRGSRLGRLSIGRMGGNDSVGKGVEDTQKGAVAEKVGPIYFSKVTNKRFVGASEVFNITVCPGHSYIANGLVVHNCPYQCAFCGGRNSPMLRRIRTRSNEQIIAEVRHLYEAHGYTGFMFYDDELNVSKSMPELMRGLKDLQRELKTEFRLRGFVKSNLFNAEQAIAMREAGFRWLLVGFESGSPRILENIRKKATREQNTACVKIAHANGLKVKALMSIGHAGESRQTIRETRQWLLDEKPDDFDCTIITTYPGTPYYDDAEKHECLQNVWTYTAKNGDRLHSYEVNYGTTADYYKGDPEGGYKAYVFTDWLTSDELVTLRDRLEADVRSELKIPFNPGAPGIKFESSMGLSNYLPPSIFRASKEAVCV